MARLYGRAQGGRRCLDAVPYGHWKSNTFIAALRYDRIEAPWMFEGAMNAR
ncbi:MAG: ISSpo6 transposase OrfB [Puniceicoccaceae bacterium 5H]|nr:MAG: ISSpo6 transposase OrfB [Puniceicoccaceae bacterium 5H]